VASLGRALPKAGDAEHALPALSNADASAKVRFAAGEIGLSDSDGATREAARLERLSVAIGAPDSPRQRFDLHWHLRELAFCASRLPFVDLEQGTLERALPRLEAAIAWLERPRIEHCPEEGVTIYYVAPGLVMVTARRVPRTHCPHDSATAGPRAAAHRPEHHAILARRSGGRSPSNRG
jgi:hypothetical protein